MASKNNPQGREKDIVVQDLKNEVLIYDLSINKAFCLNETSAMVWNLCDGNNSVAEITRKVSVKLKYPVTDDLVWLALDQFKEDNLLADGKEMEIEYGGLSRREVIKKVGFATMVALPLISAIIAPTSATAQSSPFAPMSRTVNQSCISSTDCASSAPNCNTFGTRRCCVGTGRIPSGNSANSGGVTSCANGCITRSSECCSGSITQNSCVGNSDGTFQTTCTCN